MMGKKVKCLNPLFHHSSIPISFLCALCFLFGHPLVFIRGGFRERKISIPQKDKRPSNRRDPGERREDDWKIGMMECWNVGILGNQLYYPPFHCSIIPFLFFCLNSAVSAFSAVNIFFFIEGNDGNRS